ANSGLVNPVGLAFDSGGYLYAVNENNNSVEKFDTSGNGTLFATAGLNHPAFIAVVPEPSTSALTLLAAAAFFLRRQWRCIAGAGGLLITGFLAGVFTCHFWRLGRKAPCDPAAN